MYYLCIRLQINISVLFCSVHLPWIRAWDRPEFFRDICNYLQDFQCDEGEFYLVMDIKNDKRGERACTHKNSLKEVKGICETWDVLDIRRLLNQEEERYTWRRKKPDIQCRLNFFLTSQSLISKINTSDIVPGFKTGHSMITVHGKCDKLKP